MKYATRIDSLGDRSLLNAFEIIETDKTISFSAGFPSSETYPIEPLKESIIKVMEDSGREALSYGSTSGYKRLREIIGERLKEKFLLEYMLDEIIITSGSQQGLDMSGMLFVNKGDVVLFENPSYLGAVNSLRAHEAKLVAVEIDEEGISLKKLEEALNKYKDQVKMVYVNPDFQNPTGRSWSEKRRRDFMKLMGSYDIPIIEDAAYSELSFEKNSEKPLAYYDDMKQVIYLGTFSKTLCPGLRVAWLCAPIEIMEKYLLLKNAADLSSSSIAQRQMAYFLDNYSLDKHIDMITSIYYERKETMIKCLEDFFPKSIKFTNPKGGLFIWVSLPRGKDAGELLNRALASNVSFIPGKAFYPAGERTEDMRLNFSNTSPNEILKGMRILGEITTKYINE